MPQNINQPSNRINLTNVAVVRYRPPKSRSKARFELACYKNKLLEYRSGTETELDNILQVPTVFVNVSKGMSAPKAELDKAFGPGHDKEKVIREILDKGEVQVGAGERREEKERLEREVLDLVVGRLVDPNTKRVYTAGIVKKALEVLSQKGGQRSQASTAATSGGGVRDEAEQGGQGQIKGISTGTEALTLGNPDDDTDDPGSLDNAEGPHKARGKAKKTDMPIWTGVVTTKSAKSQALEAMKALIAWQPIPVMRARMRLRITCPMAVAKQSAKSKATSAVDADQEGESEKQLQKDKEKGTVKDRILSFVEQVDSQDVMGEEWEIVAFAEPGAFKGLVEFVGGETRGKGRVEVLDMAVTHED